MPALVEKVGDVDERNSARMNFRTKPHIKRAIQRAAALSGVDDSVFTINAAYKSAIETIAAHERTLLQPADHAAFLPRSITRQSRPTSFGRRSPDIER